MSSYQTWTEALVTLAMLSFVFVRDNPAYRFCQAAYLGLATGNALVVGYQNATKLGFKPLAQGQWSLLVPIIVGLLMYTRFFPKVAWLNRYGMALIVSSGAALGLRAAIQAQFLDQIAAMFAPLNSINNVILTVGALSVIVYFFFLKRNADLFSGSLKFIPAFGRLTMMVAFGATFGTTVMGRVSLLINRVQFLMANWLGIIK